MPKDWFLQHSAVADSICITYVNKNVKPLIEAATLARKRVNCSHRSVCSRPVIATNVQAPDQAKHGKKETLMPTGVTWSKSKQNKYIRSKVNIRTHHLNS